MCWVQHKKKFQFLLCCSKAPILHLHPRALKSLKAAWSSNDFFWGKLNAYFAKEMTSWPQCLKLFQKVSIISTDSDLLFEFWSPKSKREMMRLFWGFSYSVTIALISCPFIVVIIRQMSLFPSVDQGYIWRRWIAFYQFFKKQETLELVRK